MGVSDRIQRMAALPTLGQVMGYNRNELSDLYVDQATALGDLKGLANIGGSPVKDNMIRILRPAYGQIVEAYLTMSLSIVPTDPNASFAISVGTTNSATDLTPVVPGQSAIDQGMRQMKGSATRFSGAPVINVNHLNLMPVMPQVGDANYRKDCFVLGVHFPAAPSAASPYRLISFQIDMSVQVD